MMKYQNDFNSGNGNRQTLIEGVGVELVNQVSLYQLVKQVFSLWQKSSLQKAHYLLSENVDDGVENLKSEEYNHSKRQ